MHPDVYFEHIKHRSIDQKKKAIELLEAGVKTKHNGMWNDEEVEGVKTLISRIRTSMIIVL